MHAVGIRELKNRLSHYVRLVKAGESVLVTDRGEVVAELGPPGQRARDSRFSPAILEAARRGELTLPTVRGKPDYSTPPKIFPDGTAKRLLDEERGER